MVGASTVASKAILPRPVKHQEGREGGNINQINNFVAVLFQVISPFNNSDWWLDTGAFFKKDLFYTYVAAMKNVSMVDSSTAVVLETGTVMLTLTSEKTLTLKSVKYVLSIFKNLVFESYYVRHE